MLTQIAKTLEDAADFILMRGLCRGELRDRSTDQYCTIGAIYQVSPIEEGDVSIGEVTCNALGVYLYERGLINRSTTKEGQISPIAEWSDNSPDDFVVIDTLRHCAKDIRNTESLTQ